MAGRPRLKPTAKQRNRVSLMKAAGWSNERIAAQIEIARNTLELHFAKELEFGADRKRLELMEHLEAASKKRNASASKQLIEMIDQAATLRQDAGLPKDDAPKEPRLGKKEALQRQAENPDRSSEMGELMARRMAETGRLN